MRRDAGDGSLRTAGRRCRRHLRRRPSRHPRPAREGRLVRGHVHRFAGREGAVDGVSLQRRAGRGPDPLLERPGRSRGRRLRARGARVRGQAPRRRWRGDGHPRYHDPGLRHPHPESSSSCSSCARPTRDRPARLREARRLPRRSSGGPDRDPGHGRRRPRWPASRPPSTTRRIRSSSSTPTASVTRSVIAGSPTPARSGWRTTRRRSGGATTSTRISPSGSPATARSASGSTSSAPATATRSNDPTVLWPDDRGVRRCRPTRDHRGRRRPGARRSHRRLRPGSYHRRRRALGRPDPARAPPRLLGLRVSPLGQAARPSARVAVTDIQKDFKRSSRFGMSGSAWSWS